MAAKLVLPRVHALVVCDDVVPSTTAEEAFDLHNVRTRIVAAAFPYTHPVVAVYLQLTGHEGHAHAALTIASAGSQDNPVMRLEEEIEFFGPVVVFSIWFHEENCIFPEPGLYYVQIEFDGKLLLEHPLRLILDNQATTNGQQRQ